MMDRLGDMLGGRRDEGEGRDERGESGSYGGERGEERGESGGYGGERGEERGESGSYGSA